jgi:hypothetical protein
MSKFEFGGSGKQSTAGGVFFSKKKPKGKAPESFA